MEALDFKNHLLGLRESRQLIYLECVHNSVHLQHQYLDKKWQKLINKCGFQFIFWHSTKPSKKNCDFQTSVLGIKVAEEVTNLKTLSVNQDYWIRLLNNICQIIGLTHTHQEVWLLVVNWSQLHPCIVCELMAVVSLGFSRKKSQSSIGQCSFDGF